MKKYEFEVKVITYRVYWIGEAEDLEDAKKKIFVGQGELTDEDDDSFEIQVINEY